jgi:WD40 repeat protein
LFDPSSQKLEIWNLKERQMLCSVESHHPRGSCAPTESLLATATASDTVTIWHLPQGLPKCVLPNSTPPFALSPNGTIVAAAAPSDQRIRLWKLQGSSLRQVTVVPGDDEHGGSLAFSPDGRILAVGSWEGVVRLLMLPSCDQFAVLVGHKRAVTSLSFSPDGRTLASVSDDSTVRLWHVATRREVAKLPRGDSIGDSSLAFSPDGRALAVGSARSDSSITRLWYAPSLAEIAGAGATDEPH